LACNTATGRLDALKASDNAVASQQDATTGVTSRHSSKQRSNQIKGPTRRGAFEETELRVVNTISNAELIYHLWNDDDEFVGIDKRVCGLIQMVMENNEIDNTTSFINVEGKIYPDAEMPVNARKFRGFYWRGDEMIQSVDDLFSKEDNEIVLPVIRGVDHSIDLDNPNLAPSEQQLSVEEIKEEEKGT